MVALFSAEDLDVLEPHCSGCGVKVDWEVNTKYNDKLNTQVCLNCNKAF